MTVTKTVAQAEADSLLIEARAQAEVNKLLQESLSSLLGTSSSGATTSSGQSE